MRSDRAGSMTRRPDGKKAIMDWEDRLDGWELELELNAQLEILRHRVDQLELRLAALERRQPADPAS